MTFWKGVYLTLCFDFLKSGSFNNLVKNIATVDVTGYVLYPRAMLCCKKCCRCGSLVVYTYRREVCVARFDKMGDARA